MVQGVHVQGNPPGATSTTQPSGPRQCGIGVDASGRRCTLDQGQNPGLLPGIASRTRIHPGQPGNDPPDVPLHGFRLHAHMTDKSHASSRTVNNTPHPSPAGSGADNSHVNVSSRIQYLPINPAQAPVQSLAPRLEAIRSRPFVNLNLGR